MWNLNDHGFVGEDKWLDILVLTIMIRYKIIIILF